MKKVDSFESVVLYVVWIKYWVFKFDIVECGMGVDVVYYVVVFDLIVGSF